MAWLTVALQDGFAEDLVIVRINRAEIFRKEDVTTKLLLGYAESFTMQVPEGQVDVEILVPLRNLSETIVVPVSTTAYLGLSIQDREIVHRLSNEPFGYL